jgi:hypothetical protein
LNLDIAAPLHHLDPFVVLIDGDGEFLLGVLLADHIFVQKGFDLGWFGQRGTSGCRFLLGIITDNLDANIDAFIANVYRGAGDQFLDFILAFTTETAS